MSLSPKTLIDCVDCLNADGEGETSAASGGPARTWARPRWASPALVRPARSLLAGAMPPDEARPFSGARGAPPRSVLRHARTFVRGVVARTRIRTLAAVQQSRPRAAQHCPSSGRQRGTVRPRRLRRYGPAQPRRQRARAGLAPCTVVQITICSRQALAPRAPSASPRSARPLMGGGNRHDGSNLRFPGIHPKTVLRERGCSFGV